MRQHHIHNITTKKAQWNEGICESRSKKTGVHSVSKLTTIPLSYHHLPIDV